MNIYYHIVFVSKQILNMKNATRDSSNKFHIK